YEGTNGIQAMDMVGRKLMDGGAAARALIAGIAATAAAAGGERGARLGAAAEALEDATGWMVGAEANDRVAGAVPYLRAFALALGGHYLTRAALAGGDAARGALADFHLQRLLPQVDALCAAACEGAEGLYAVELDA